MFLSLFRKKEKPNLTEIPRKEIAKKDVMEVRDTIYGSTFFYLIVVHMFYICFSQFRCHKNYKGPWET